VGCAPGVFGLRGQQPLFFTDRGLTSILGYVSQPRSIRSKVTERSDPCLRGSFTSSVVSSQRRRSAAGAAAESSLPSSSRTLICVDPAMCGKPSRGGATTAIAGAAGASARSRVRSEMCSPGIDRNVGPRGNTPFFCE